MLRGSIPGGASYLGRGARLLLHPSLRLFVLVPLLVNVVIFGSLITVGVTYIDRLMDWLQLQLPEWLSFIEWILWPLIAVMTALLTGYLFTAVALIIASPFNSLLAEKTEELVTGQTVDSGGLREALWAAPKGIVRELSKLAYYIPIALLVLIISILPGFNATAPLLWFLLGAWMMSIQFVDYPVDNHRMRFADVKQAVRSRRLSSMGFGGLVALCAGVPFLNFFVVPSAVVGATLLWCEELRDAAANTPDDAGSNN